MAQTFKDFMIECELYPYSKENFELMKECVELKLQERYLENARYIASTAAIFTEANGFHLSEGYFQEAVDDSFLEATAENTGKKKIGLIGKIINGVKWLIGKLAKFFNFIGGKLEKLSEKFNPVLEKVRAFDITKDNAEALRDAIWSKGTSAWNNTAIPFINKLAFKYKDVSGDVRAAIDYYCCILFGSDGFFIKPGDTNGPINLANYDGMLRGSDITNIANHFIQCITTGADTSSLQTKLQEKAEVIQKKGIKVESDKAIAAAGDALAEVQKKLDEQTAIWNSKQAADDELGGFDADNISAMQKALADFTKSVGATQRFYADLAKFKADGVKNLNAFIDGQNAKAADEEKLEDQGQSTEPTKEENK